MNADERHPIPPTPTRSAVLGGTDGLERAAVAYSPTVTVQFSLIHNGWTVPCWRCRSCLGSYGKESEAVASREQHRLGHQPVSGPTA